MSRNKIIDKRTELITTRVSIQEVEDSKLVADSEDLTLSTWVRLQIEKGLLASPLVTRSRTRLKGSR